MRDNLRQHVFLMLAGVFLGVWFSEMLPSLRRWVHTEWFLAAAIILLVMLYLPRSLPFLPRREPQETVRRWRLQGEQFREQILVEPDATTEAEQDAQRERWYQMWRGTGTRFGWSQMAAAALGEINAMSSLNPSEAPNSEGNFNQANSR